MKAICLYGLCSGGTCHQCVIASLRSEVEHLKRQREFSITELSEEWKALKKENEDLRDQLFKQGAPGDG